jgi:hypothetical protein
MEAETRYSSFDSLFIPEQVLKLMTLDVPASEVDD